MQSTRLIIHEASPSQNKGTFAADVRAGLSAHPKHLVPKYFYDALGSHLFESISYLPEYYLTRAETDILARFAPIIAAQLADEITLVELGSGSSVKTRYLIEALLERQGRLHYQPIDISTSMLNASSIALLNEYPGLRITAIAGDYTCGLNLVERKADERVLVLFLGSNIGNYEPEEAIALLKDVRGWIQRDDALLIGVDLKKSVAVLEAAYNDALGVTAAFNRNLLLRVNRELGGDFDLTRFAHRAIYDKDEGRIEMYLESCGAQKVAIHAIDLIADFAAGETIHTENSYKYNRQELVALAAETGFRVAHSWFDERAQFSCNLWFVA